MIKTLPYVGIPIVENKTPDITKRIADLKNWANGDMKKLSAAFVAVEGMGDKFEDFLFMVGYIEDGRLVTSKKVIEAVCDDAVEYPNWEEYTEALPEIRNHLEEYASQVGVVPRWGSKRFYDLMKDGKTAWTLSGPHKSGSLRKGEKRLVVKDVLDELAFGPLL